MVESLPFERAEGGEDLLFVSGGGMEDMVVGGRQERRMSTSGLGFLNDQVGFVGENEDRGFPQRRVTCHRLGHDLILNRSQRGGLRETSHASVTSQPIHVPQSRWREIRRRNRFTGLVVVAVRTERIYRPHPSTASTRLRSVQGRKEENRSEIHQGDGGRFTSIPQ